LERCFGKVAWRGGSEERLGEATWRDVSEKQLGEVAQRKDSVYRDR